MGHIESALCTITMSMQDNCKRCKLACTLSIMCFRDKPRSSDLYMLNDQEIIRIVRFYFICQINIFLGVLGECINSKELTLCSNIFWLIQQNLHVSIDIFVIFYQVQFLLQYLKTKEIRYVQQENVIMKIFSYQNIMTSYYLNVLLINQIN